MREILFIGQFVSRIRNKCLSFEDASSGFLQALLVSAQLWRRKECHLSQGRGQESNIKTEVEKKTKSRYLLFSVILYEMLIDYLTKGIFGRHKQLKQEQR